MMMPEPTSQSNITHRASGDVSDTLLTAAIPIERRWPVNLDTADVGDFDYEQRFKTTDSYLRRLGSAWVSPDSVIYKNGFVIDDTLAHPNYRRYYRLKHLVKKALTSPKVYLPKDKQYLLVTDSWSDSHFHWLTDAVPKLVALGETIAEYTLLLPDTPYMKSIGVSSLELAGLRLRDYQFMRESDFYHAPDLSFITRVSKSGSMQDVLMKELQTRFTSGRTTGNRRIYISRKKARIRYILNDDDVISCLKDYGFETPFAEDLSLSDQIDLFSSTQIILGIHGAGLTNALFMKPGGTVVELRRREGPIGNVCYWHLADSLDHKYYYFNGVPDRDHILSGTGCNLTISIPDLEKKVLQPLLSSSQS